MILKYLKFSTTFIEILKNSTSNKNFCQKYLVNNIYRFQNYGSFSSVVSSSESGALSYTLSPSSSVDSKNDEWKERLKGVGATKTELLEIRGPKGAGFLVEVYDRDREEVRKQVNDLSGEYFSFDRNILARFTIKCLIIVEPIHLRKDLLRLAKIHAITTGSEEVYEIKGKNQFLFVNTLNRATRVKRMLEKLGYRICNLLFRFLPSEKITMENLMLQKCYDFVKIVEKLPKVISVTHNL